MDFSNLRPAAQNIYIETYGCQMNVGDSEIAASIFKAAGWGIAPDVASADVVLINTCAIRDNAEQRIFARLGDLRAAKRARKGALLIGVIGCMAERLKEQLLQKVDIVAGPDTYRILPELVQRAAIGQKAIDTALSTIETYNDIAPLRTDANGVSGYVSIMRGCNNFCSYCVVPYTRGRERSRDADAIIAEVKTMLDGGYKEVTLLGQNVNSYKSGEISFAELLAAVAAISPELRVRFSTSHPKDLSDELIRTMAAHPNIARSIHLPVQSGSDEMLRQMNRRYTRQWYLGRVAAIRAAMPDCGITTDIIAGFCGETEADHKQTLSLMNDVGFDFAYMFAYSLRPDTYAHKHFTDDVPPNIKTERLTEIIAFQKTISLKSNQADIGRRFEVLVEGRSKKSEQQLVGRTSQNKVAVFDRVDGVEAGDFVAVKVTSVTSATLKCIFLKKLSKTRCRSSDKATRF